MNITDDEFFTLIERYKSIERSKFRPIYVWDKIQAEISKTIDQMRTDNEPTDYNNGMIDGLYFAKAIIDDIKRGRL